MRRGKAAHEVLGVKKGARRKEIDRAYRAGKSGCRGNDQGLERMDAMAKNVKEKSRKKPEYTVPDGWRIAQMIGLPLAAVKASTKDYDTDEGAIIRKAFNRAWKAYTESLKGKPIGNVLIAAHPTWIQAALASEEMAGQQTQTNSGLMLYGLRIREDNRVPTSLVYVEEKI